MTTEIDRSLIGSLSEPFVVEVERGAIRRFAEAIGDADPVYVDEAAARAAGYAGLPAPPTFPTSFRPPREPAWTRDLDRRRILAGETWFEYERPVVAGMRLQCRLRFEGVEDKAGSRGGMSLIHQQLIVRALDASGEPGELVVTCGRTTVYRDARDGAAKEDKA